MKNWRTRRWLVLGLETLSVYPSQVCLLGFQNKDNPSVSSPFFAIPWVAGKLRFEHVLGVDLGAMDNRVMLAGLDENGFV